MPAKSVKQQQFFGTVLSYKDGDLKNPSKAVKNAADSMTRKEVEDFAKTKHKGLPEKVKESKECRKNAVNLSEKDLHRIVKNSVRKILAESMVLSILQEVGNAIGPFEQALYKLQELPDEEAQTLAVEGMKYLERLDDYLAQ